MSQNNCSLISGKEALILKEMFAKFASNSLDLKKFNSSSFVDDNVDEFVNKVLASDLANRYDREISIDEMEFIYSRLSGMAVNMAAIYRGLARNFDPNVGIENKNLKEIATFFNAAPGRLGTNFFELQSLNKSMVTMKAQSSTHVPLVVKTLPIPSKPDETPAKSIITSPEIAITSFTGLQKQSDINRVFMGSLSAQTVMEKTMHLNIVRRFMVNKEKGIYNSSNADVDKTIKDYKSKTFFDLVEFIKSKYPSGIEFEPTDNQLYIYNVDPSVNILNPNYQNIINKISNYYTKVVQIKNTTLEDWSKGITVNNQIERKNYIDFVIMANFDNLLKMYGHDIFQVSDSLANNPLETREALKYAISVNNNMSSNPFSKQEVFALAEEQTSLYKMLMKSMPFISKNGRIDVAKEIDIITINSTIARMLSYVRNINNSLGKKSKIPDFDRSNPTASLKEVLEFFVKEHTNPGKTRQLSEDWCNASELDVLLSLYLTFYRSSDGAELKSIVGDNFYRTLNEKQPFLNGENILSFIGPSYYQLSAKTYSDTENFGLDYTSVITSNFNKTYFNNYTEVTYDGNYRQVTINTPDSKLYEGDAATLRNGMNTLSNYEYTEDQINADLEGIKVNLDNGTVTFEKVKDGKDLVVDLKNETVLLDKSKLDPALDNDLLTSMNSVMTEKIEKNLPSINIKNDTDLLEAIHLKVDTNNNSYINTTETLAKMTSACIFIKQLMASTGNIEEAKKNKFLKARKDSGYTIINEKRGQGEILVTGLYGKISDDINLVAKAIALINGSMYRAVIKVANGTSMPLQAEIRHMYVTSDHLKMLVKDNGGHTRGMPLENNFYLNNPHMILDPSIRTYTKVGDQIKHSSELSPQELAQTMILHEYYGSMVKSNEVFIQTTVFTDKNTHNLLKVPLNKKVTLNGPLGQESEYTLLEAGPERLKQSMFFGNRKYYKNLGERMFFPYNQAISEYVTKSGMTIETFAAQHKLPALNASTKNKIDTIDKWMKVIPEDKFREAFARANGSRFSLVEDLGISVFKNADGTKNIGLSETLVEYSKIYSGSGQETTAAFEKLMEDAQTEFADSLKEFGVKIQYIKYGQPDSILLEALEKLNENPETFAKNWVTPSGFLKLRDKDGKLNPIFNHYFWTDIFVSDSYQQATMGTIHSHPTKGKIYSNRDRISQVTSLKTAMMFKRQLQGTPMKPFLQGHITGTTNKIKTAYLSDVNLPVFNSFGTEDFMKTSDGMTITPMAQIIMQNNSLMDNKVGTNMKTLGLSMDPYYNSFGLMKHAEFGASNEWTRRSVNGRFDLRNLYTNAYGIPFSSTLPNGVEFRPNLLTDFNGRPITINTIAPDGLFYYKDGTVYQVVKMSHAQTITGGKRATEDALSPDYVFSIKNMTTNETEDTSVTINTLFDLWENLGAENSVSFNPNGAIQGSYSYSDASHYALTEIMNRVGVWLDEKGKKYLRERYGLTDAQIMQWLPNKKFDKSRTGKIPTQNEVWQPLKDNFIGKFVFSSAQKAGAQSIQSVNKAFSVRDSENPMVHSEISILSTGLLMDSDHHIEDSELTEMSQIIAALIFNGETYSIADDAYSSLGKLVGIKLKKLIDGVEEFKQFKDKNKLYKEVTKFLVKTFESKDQQSIAGFVASLAKKDMLNSATALPAINEEIAEEALRNTAEEEGDSDKMNSMLEMGAKMPFSSNLYNSFVTLLANNLNKVAIKRKHPGMASVVKPSGGIVQMYEVPVTGKEGNVQVHIVTSDVFRNKYKGQTSKVPMKAEDASLFEWVTGADGVDIYLDTTVKLRAFKKTNLGKTISRVYGLARDLKPVEVKFNMEGRERSMSIFETDDFGVVMSFLDLQKMIDNDKVDPAQKLKNIKALFKSPDFNMKLFKEILATSYTSEAIKLLIADPVAFSTQVGKISQVFKNRMKGIFRELERNSRININGKWVPVTNVVTIPGEALGPNIYRNKFGFPEGISRDDVTVEYIETRLNLRSMPRTDDADMFLVRNDGNHIYIFNENSYEYHKANFLPSDLNVQNIEGENWVVDDFGDKEYKVDEGTQIFKYRSKNGELLDAVVVDSPETIQKYFKGAKPNDDIGKRETIAQNSLHAIHVYSSFHMANEFTSARIPGQGPQSFTPLQIIEFLDTESNTIMTNHFTTWLKGEDYDIDKGFWLGVTVDKRGKFVGWSSAFDYSTPAQLKLSTRLPIPDGNVKLLSSEQPRVTLTLEEATSILESKLTKLKVDTLNKLARVTTYNVEGLPDESISVLVDKVNEYFTEQLSDLELENGVKNKVSRSIFNMISSPLNQVHAESPITLGEVQEAAAKSAASEKLNPYNPALKYLLQDANMIGKQVIGIAAVGLKIWSTLSYWGNNKITNNNFDDIFINKEITVNGKKHTFPTIANLNFGNQIAEEEEAAKDRFINFIISKLETLGKSKEGIAEIVKEARDQFNLNYDQSLVLSAILSAATDNAKELALAKINAGPLTAGVYAYLTMLGVPFSEISDMMISKDIKWIVKNARTNIYDKSTIFRNVKNATKAWTTGPRLFNSVDKVDKYFAIENWVRIAIPKIMTLTPWQKTFIAVKKGEKPADVLSVVQVRQLLAGEPDKDGNTKEVPFEAVKKYFADLRKLGFPDVLAQVQRGTLSDEEADMAEEFGDEFGASTKGGLNGISRDMHKYFDEIENYFEEVGDTTSGTRQSRVDEFDRIYKDAEEITLLGRILSINQGIKTSPYTQYSFHQSVDSFVLDKFSDYIYGEPKKEFDPQEVKERQEILYGQIAEKFGITRLEAKKLLNENLGRFSFKRYLASSGTEREVVKFVYNKIKSTFNIFDIIDTAPQFKAMLKVPGLMEDIKDTLSVRARSINNMIEEIFENEILVKDIIKDEVTGEIEFERKHTISDKNYVKISDFCNDILILKWLRKLKPEKSQFTYKAKGQYKFNDDNELKYIPFESPTDITIDLATIEGRRGFIDVFHNLMVDFKRDPKYAQNSFIQSLRVDWKADNLTGAEYQFYKLPINILSVNDYNRGAFNAYVLAFNDLAHDVDPQTGMNVKDLFYLYDTLVHKGKVNRESLGKFFEYDNNYSTDSLLYDFISTIGDMDFNNEVLTEISKAGALGDYDIDEIIIKGFAEKIFPTETDKFKGKYAYSVVNNGDDTRSVQYYKWDKVSESYQEYSHFMDSRAMPFSTNSPRALSKVTKLKTDLYELIKGKLLTLRNIQNIQINCN